MFRAPLLLTGGTGQVDQAVLRHAEERAPDIAQTLLCVTEQWRAHLDIWHFVNSGEASWYDLAATIFVDLDQRGLITFALNANPNPQYPTPATRPSNSHLSMAAILRDFGIKQRHWLTRLMGYLLNVSKYKRI